MHSHTDGNHSSLIQAAISDNRTRAATVNPGILDSWKRCAQDYGLAPESHPKPHVLEQTALKERLEKFCQLVEIARNEMTSLYQQVAGSGHSILLTDSDGVVLNYVGDPLFASAAAKAGMQTGAIWDEPSQGTNGMGTCLVEKRPIIIHQSEHFFSKNTRLTCSAAPILDPHGKLIAVLDASSESTRAQQHTMALVNMSAQLIENRVFLCKMQENYIIRFHSRPEFLSTFGEGAIAVDPGGIIQSANRSALFQLDIDHVEEVNGRPLEEYFSLCGKEAVEHAHKPSGKPLPLRESRQGKRFYALFQTPMTEVSRKRHQLRSSPTEARTTVAAEKDALSSLEFGDSRMQANIIQAKKLLEKDIPFMLLGETGTGKDMFATAVHQGSNRSHKPFVAINCASLPETLIESELFGYRPGAFTGANRDGSRGKILQANEGTLFLDEIGDMPLHLQARLLRVLEERKVYPLGSETPLNVDIRLISATHQDLQQKIKEGKFREDLYYRLHGISLSMPPFRDREDRIVLIEHLLSIEAGDNETLVLSNEALELLDTYRWPGNIRQLRNVLRTLVGLCENNRILPEDLPEEIFKDLTGRVPDEQTDTRPSNPLEIAERDTLLRELKTAHWNVTKVASKLNVSRNTLYRKMQRYGIKPPR